MHDRALSPKGEGGACMCPCSGQPVIVRACVFWANGFLRLYR